MTDEGRGLGGVVGPPWSVDVLADLHAGVLDEREAAALWPQVNADPEARAIIDALESTTGDLATLAAAPVEPMPADVAARIDAALAQERDSTGTVVSLDAARRRRKRNLGWGAGLLTAAAAVAAAVAIAVPEPTVDGTPNVALSFEGDQLGAAFDEVNGVRDFGGLDNQKGLDACLDASGISLDEAPIGVRPATIDGEPAVLALYTTGELAQFRLIAVAPDCGPGNPGVLRDETIGKSGG